MQFKTLALLLAAPLLAYGQMTTEQKVTDFTSLSQFYVRHYTPANWKIVQFGFDLSDLRPWLAKVRATKTDMEYYDVAIEYLAMLQDGHIRYTVPTNFQAYLRFDVDIYDGKTLIELIANGYPMRDFPIEIGDELVSVDGLSSEQWIQRLSRYGIGANDSATRRRAADFITFRPQQSIPWAPQIGETAKVVIRKQDGTEKTYDLPWFKSGTPITNLPPVSGPRLSISDSTQVRNPADRYAGLAAQWGVYTGERQVEAETLSAEEREARSTQMGEAHPVDVALTGLGQLTPLYGPPAGLRLRLGTGQNDLFLSGTFPLDGKTVGWIRIPTFGPANTTLAITQFRNEIAALQNLTSGLVIDVMHNPGGNVCYAQELMRYLVPKPFWGIGYWIKPTLAWKVAFDTRARSAQNPQVEAWERELLGEYDRLLSAAYEKGEETGIYPVCAASVVVIPQDVVYTKPILLLTNEFSISAGDTFSAMFQDAARGKIVGIRTGGLGGNVNDYFNTGITEANLRITRSLFIRENAVPSPYGPTRFMENVGVAPDVKLDIMTRENLLSGGRPFVAGWLEEVRKILQ